MQKAEGVIIMYDVHDRQSFEQIDTWKSSLEDARDIDNTVVALIANKIDLPNR